MLTTSPGVVFHVRVAFEENWAQDDKASDEEPDGGTPPPDANMTVIFLFVCFLKINLVIPPPLKNSFFHIWIWVC